jgi:hypothetical protein
VEKLSLSGGFFGHFRWLAAVRKQGLRGCSVVISWSQTRC